MRWAWDKAIAILLAAVVFLMSTAAVQSYSHAQTVEVSEASRSLTTVNEKGQAIRCGDVAEAKQGVLIGYIVPCVTYAIEKTTMRMSKAMIDWLKPVIYAFMTLVIVLFGVRVVQGGGGPVHGEAILLLLKMGLVIALLEIIPTRVVPLLYDVMNEGLDVVSTTVSPDVKSLRCDTDKFRNPKAPFVWAQMDCLTSKLFGIALADPGPSGEKRPNMLLAASVFGMLGGFMFGGTFGFILFMTLVGVLWLTFMLILRTISAFLNGYLYASMLLLIAPLFLPLIMLRATAQYFEPWWKGILAGILLPILICCYTMFAMLLYDRMLFNDSKDPKQRALLYKLFDTDLMKQAQKASTPVCPGEFMGDTKFMENAQGKTKEQMNKLTKVMNQNFGAENGCGGLKVPKLDMTKAFTNRTNGEAFKDLFKDAIKLLVLAVLINMGYTNIAGLARRLIGSGGVASTLDARGPVEDKLTAMSESVKASIGQTLGKKGGDEFLANIAKVPGAIGTGLRQGIER